jgi:hypothetical protein
MKKDVIANALNGVWYVLIIVGFALGSAYMQNTEAWQHLIVCLGAGLSSFLPQWGFNQGQGQGHQSAASVNKEVKTAWKFGGITSIVFAVVVLVANIKNWSPVWITGIVVLALALILHGGIFKLFAKKK